jgi:hypothetical protein
VVSASRTKLADPLSSAVISVIIREVEKFNANLSAGGVS